MKKNEFEMKKILFFCVCFFILPYSLWSGIDKKNEASSVENVISVQNKRDGFIVYNNLKKIGFIDLQVFTKDGKFHPFEVSSQSSHTQYASDLSDGKVFLKVFFNFLKSGIHIRYTLKFQKAIKDVGVYCCVRLVYNDWVNSYYQIGSKQGRVPLRLVSGKYIANTYAKSFQLGPSEVYNGLMLNVDTQKEFGLGLEANDQYDGSLNFYLIPSETRQKQSDWKAGESKVFDFEFGFNRRTNSLEDELNSLVPKIVLPQKNQLTSAELAFGRSQLERMLRDRPAMSPYVREGDELWNWMIRQFAGEYVKGGIWWDARNPKPLWDAMSYDAVRGEKAHIQVSKNRYISKDNHYGEPKTGPILWIETIFEIFNLKLSNLDYSTEILAKQGKISKEELVFKEMLKEEQTKRLANDFFNKTWIPHCKKLSLPYEDQFVKHAFPGNATDISPLELFDSRFKPDDFHYNFFANEYERLFKS